jgi:hypothetical protein
MRRRQRGFVEILTRSLAVAGLLYAALIAYAVPATLLRVVPEPTPGLGADASRLSGPVNRPIWRASHADRFPGCVDMAQWTSKVVPSTVVVVRLDGRLQQMPFDEAFRRATSASSADNVWTIGACD